MQKENIEFYNLIVKAQESRLSEEESLQLNEMMKSADNQKLYFEIVKVNCALRQLESNENISLMIGDSNNDAGFNNHLWQQLAEYERNAPNLEIPAEKEELTSSYSCDHVKVTPKVSKLSIYTLVVSAAAMLFLVLLIKFAPSKTGYDVATLHDCINARWAGTESVLQKGQRLFTGRDVYSLQSGLVEIEFDSNVKAVIEAPAGFRILTDDRISMDYGKVYVSVPKTAIGFSVYTPSAKIVDMGTEFGVLAETNGDTDLQVHKGKVTLMAGEDDVQLSMDVLGGRGKESIVREKDNIKCSL